MKAVRIHAWGNNDVVKIEEVPTPTIKENEVLVAVHAAGVNPVDWKVREGYYAAFLENAFPLPMGWDFSGTVVDAAVGSPYKKGDEVYGLIRFFAPAGCFAEYVSAPIEQISHKPSRLNHNEAAGVPLVALTAWQALFETANLKPKQKVLIHAGAGAVGQMAIQLAKWKGAYVVATASSGSKDLVMSLGVDQFINYQTEIFDEKVKDVDLVLDLVGNDFTSRSLSVLKNGGQLINFTQPISPEVEAQAKARDIDARFTIVQPNGEQLHLITHLIDDGIINTKIEKAFPLAQVKEALALQQSGHCHGKVILTVKE